ncbi:MAG: YitT family protein [Firmicutes bacterium]|nr:YitT family protein [Bacillota bacterium]
MKNFNFKKEAKTLYQVILGTAISVLGIVFFLDPVGLYTGGVTGLSQLIINVVSMVTGGSTLINLGLLVFVFQIPLLIFGWKKLSKRFIIYTLISSVIGSAIMVYKAPVSILGNDLITSGIIGGILGGIGNGILANAGTSGGGTSIIFQYLSIKTGKSMGSYQIIFHGAIILLAGIIFGLDIAIYTIVSQIMSSIVLDKVFTGYNFIKIEAITEHGPEIADVLKSRLPHGVTMIDAVGAYYGREKKILYAVISVHEMQQYLKLINDIDPNAFVVFAPVQNVKGKFTKKIIN